MWVSGDRNPSPRSIDRIADVFAVDVDFLLTLAGHRPLDLDDERDVVKREIMPLLRKLDLTDAFVLDHVKRDLKHWIDWQSNERRGT